MRIEFLLTGNELLTGDLDPYPAGMIGAIKRKGATVARVTVLPDETDEISSELDAAYARGTGLLLVTGGLGPTIDDVTRHALASFLGKKLVVDPAAKGWVEEALAKRHRRRPESSSPAMLMAMVPGGSEALRNLVGVACGVKVTVAGMTIVCVPGFPREMRAMFDADFLPLVEAEGVHEETLLVKRGETAMEPLFQKIAKEFGVRVASLPQENWRESGNVVVIRGSEEKARAAAKRFLELLEATGNGAEGD